jgi:hypothetical protein
VFFFFLGFNTINVFFSFIALGIYITNAIFQSFG